MDDKAGNETQWVDYSANDQDSERPQLSEIIVMCVLQLLFLTFMTVIFVTSTVIYIKVIIAIIVFMEFIPISGAIRERNKKRINKENVDGDN